MIIQQIHSAQKNVQNNALGDPPHGGYRIRHRAGGGIRDVSNPQVSEWDYEYDE
jgi:hypothetical protein